VTAGTSAFAALARADEQQEQWRRRKLDARRRIAALGDQALFQSLAGTLATAYNQKQPLPDHEELRELVENLLGDLRNDDGNVAGKPTDQDVTVVTSGAMAAFVCSSEPRIEVLAAASKVEFYLDLQFVAEIVAKSEQAGNWLSLLQKLKFDLNSINDDEYQASDELARWQKELQRSVPSWHEGNFPTLSRSVELIVSALLRAMDVDAWLKFLDRLPIPALIESLLWYTSLERAPESVLDWIRRAPLAFDQTGARTASALVFILERKALGLLEASSERRSREKENDDDPIGASDDARRELAAAIKERADGEVLLIELAARSLVRAQSGQPESTGARLRQDLQHAIAISYSCSVGTPSDVLRLSRTRAAIETSRSLLGLWLLAPARAEREFEEHKEEATRVLQNSWPWLVEILCARDAGIAERYSPTAQWTERLGGLALAASLESASRLEAAWQVLAPQRLARVETRYERDPWSTSRFLMRTGFFASRLEQDAATGLVLWSGSMEMAISAWFARTNQDPFAEVKYGLAHLAAGKLQVVGEPARTFEYLVGEPDEFADAVFGLLDNAFDPSGVVQAASAIGIDAIAYLRLLRNKAKEAAIERALATLTRTGTVVPGVEGKPNDEERDAGR
jgi:hypothetical protein